MANVNQFKKLKLPLHLQPEKELSLEKKSIKELHINCLKSNNKQ